MGERSNIRIHEGQSDPGVFIYTHWRGPELPLYIHKALARDCRWCDTPYLARIIFETCIVESGSEGDECGWGLSTNICDTGWGVWEVDTEAQEVRWNPDSAYGWPANNTPKHRNDQMRWTFKQFAREDFDTTHPENRE